jgi:hypothetical protein
VSDPQAGNAVFTERCLSSGEFVASEAVALARLFPTDDSGARSDDDGSFMTRQAAFLSGALLDCGVTPVVALSLGLGILSPVHLRSFEVIDSRARPSAPPVSNWVNQQDDITCDRHPAGYDPKGSLLDMAERNVPGISSGEVRGGGCKPQEYPKKAEDRS